MFRLTSTPLRTARNCRAAMSVANVQPSAALGRLPSPWYSIDLQVRDYELDQYSVVNNAVYSSYFQHCRHEFLHEKGLDADQVARSGRALALSDISIKFMQPLRSRETFTSRLRIVKLTAARIVFEQQLLKVERTTGAETLVATAEATAVVLDDNYRPVRVEKEMQEMLLSSAPDA